MAGEGGQPAADRQVFPPIFSRDRHHLQTNSILCLSLHCLQGENGRPQPKNNDEPWIFIKTGSDISTQPFSLTGYQGPVNYKQCAEEAGSTGLSFERLN